MIGKHLTVLFLDLLSDFWMKLKLFVGALSEDRDVHKPIAQWYLILKLVWIQAEVPRLLAFTFGHLVRILLLLLFHRLIELQLGHTLLIICWNLVNLFDLFANEDYFECRYVVLVIATFEMLLVFGSLSLANLFHSKNGVKRYAILRLVFLLHGFDFRHVLE